MTIIHHTLPLLASALVAGCATVAAGPEGDSPAVGELVFANTSQTCSTSVDLILEVASERVAVPAGESVSLRVPVGRHVARLQAAGAGSDAPPLERLTLTVPTPAGAGAYFGCVAPEFLRPAADRAPVEVVHHVTGCAPGKRGAALLSIAGRPFARVAPGESVDRYLPAGRYEVRVSVAGGSRQTRPLIVSAAGARLTLGCPAGAFAGGALLPLTVRGPPPGCRPDRRCVVRAAGVVIDVGRGEAWTVFAPRGLHLVEVAPADGGGRGGVSQTLRIALGDAGAVIQPVRCAGEDHPDAR